MKTTSSKDPIVVDARSLQSSSYRKKHNKALLYELKQIEWAIKASLIIECIFIEKGNRSLLISSNTNANVIEVSSGILKKISGVNYTIPCLAVVNLKKEKTGTDDFLLVLDKLQDFGNIGSIVRTAKGFCIHQFLFTGMQTDAFQKKVIDASRGMVFNSHILEKETTQEAIAYLKKNDYQIVVSSPHAKNLQSQAPLSTKKIALIVGNETSGVSDEFLQLADVMIQIPMSLQVESFNVSVSTGISIYELKFKQVLMMLKEKIFLNFGRRVGVTAKLIRMVFDKEIKKVTDLSGMQVIALMIMHCDGVMSKKQISKDTALFADELEQFLRVLLEKNYISLIKNNYSLTLEGQRFIAEIWPVIERNNQKIMAQLSNDESKQLEELLLKVRNGCIKILND